jgi:hypothetical protein
MSRLRCQIGVVFVLISAAGLAAQTQPAAPDSVQPLTAQQRFQWFAKSTLGPETLAAGVFSTALSTATNSPSEYGPHWEGFGKRYGMRLTGISTGNAMEGGLGALWGEDPRYFRVPDRNFKGRVGNIVKMTFAAPRADGHIAPAYARLIAIPGSNFLSNTWRADSEADAQNAALRTLYGFLGRMGTNAFKEFWPDVSHHVFRRKR